MSGTDVNKVNTLLYDVLIFSYDCTFCWCYVEYIQNTHFNEPKKIEVLLVRTRE